jgi:predicted RNase H-like HicB family nuclease
MENFVYPAIFVKDEDEDVYRVLFPDLELTTDGAFIEEAYLYAKEVLKAYFVYIQKYDLDYNLPTDFEKIMSNCERKDIVMLVDAQVSVGKNKN